MPREEASGIVIKLMPDKGFGFIADHSGTKYFFHRSAVQGGAWNQLQSQSPVTFTIGEGPKGLRAENVRLQE